MGQVTKRNKKPKITKRHLRPSAKITGILLDVGHENDIKRRAEFDRLHPAEFTGLH